MQAPEFQAAAVVEWHPVFSLYHAIDDRANKSPMFLRRTLQVLVNHHTRTSPPHVTPRVAHRHVKEQTLAGVLGAYCERTSSACFRRVPLFLIPPPLPLHRSTWALPDPPPPPPSSPPVVACDTPRPPPPLPHL